MLGVNTLGAAVAPWLFGVVLLPAIGAKLALLAVAVGYLALSSARAWRVPTQWVVVATGVDVRRLDALAHSACTCRRAGTS